MTELKTLKDFEKIKEDHSHEIEDCCREEGVEAVLFELQKSAEEDLQTLNNLKTPEDILWEQITGNKIVYSQECIDTLKRYIRWKFNITEGELK
jgi:hypothetical protein